MNSKASKLKKEYECLQKEGDDIYKQIKPLLKRLKSLAKKCIKLEEKLDSCKDMYKTETVKYIDHNGNEGTREWHHSDGWNEFALFRLDDFKFLVDDGMDYSIIDTIDNVLYNLKHTKIGAAKRKHGQEA